MNSHSPKHPHTNSLQRARERNEKNKLWTEMQIKHKCTYFQKCISRTVFLFSRFNCVIEAKRSNSLLWNRFFIKLYIIRMQYIRHLTLVRWLQIIGFVCNISMNERDRAECMRPYYFTSWLRPSKLLSTGIYLLRSTFAYLFFLLNIFDGHQTTPTITQLMASISAAISYLVASTRHKCVCTTFRKKKV